MYDKIAKDKGYGIVAAWMSTDMVVMTVTLFPTVFIPLGLHWLLCGLLMIIISELELRFDKAEQIEHVIGIFDALSKIIHRLSVALSIFVGAFFCIRAYLVYIVFTTFVNVRHNCKFVTFRTRNRPLYYSLLTMCKHLYYF